MLQQLVTRYWKWWLAIAGFSIGVGGLLGSYARISNGLHVEAYAVIISALNAIIGGWAVVDWYPEK